MDKLIIFDLDGTLLDTLPDLSENVNTMLSHFNFPLITDLEARSYIGNGLSKLVERSLPENFDKERFDEYFSYCKGVYDKSKNLKTKFFDGMVEVLKEFKKRGYKLAICTNKPQKPTENVYNQYLKEFDFDIVVGQSDNVKRKPDPTATLDIIDKLNVKKENVYFVGDGDADVLTAKNAGIKCISALWGYRDKEELIKVGATIFASKPLDLIDLI